MCRCEEISKDPNEERKLRGHRALAWTWVTRASPWSQARGWGSTASAWWPSGHSQKREHGTPLQ